MKKLLIITQKVDKDDPILGFFHRWIEEFAKNVERVTVICLERGKFNLPENVKVLSLGKEGGQSRLKYLFNFYKYLWRERKNYGVVFVHMNQEYVLLGCLFWKIWGKKVIMWRNHATGNFFTRVAVYLSDKVFCTSPQSYTAKFRKTEIMPVGVDAETFFSDPVVKKMSRSILALGRISAVKRLTLLVQALLELSRRQVNFTATIVGSPVTGADEVYEKRLHLLAESLIRSGQLVFRPAVPNHQTPDIYRAHEIYVNLTPSGSMDKTIFEAMACGCVVILEKEDGSGLAGKIEKKFSTIPGRYSASEHSLISLVQLLAKNFIS